MTIQRSVEEIIQAFPEVGITQVINDLDKAQKDFVLETNFLTTIVALTSISTTAKFTLPADFNCLIGLLAYDSNGMPVYLSDLNIMYSIDDTYLYVYRSDKALMTGIPASVSSLKLKYYNKPVTLTAVTSNYSINDEFKSAIEAIVYEKYYSRFAVNVLTGTGQVIKTRDFNAVRYWHYL